MRRTECRLPQGFQAADLGQSIVTADGRCALISFATAPLVIGRDNGYVVLITEASLASVAHSFKWTFTESAGVPTERTTSVSENTYSPAAAGSLTVKVTVLDSGGGERATVTLEQPSIAPSEQLEALITTTRNTPGPGCGDPSAAREVVNELAVYYQQISPPTPQDGEAFRRFLFDMVLTGVTRRTALERRRHLDQLAGAVSDDPQSVPGLAAIGGGVCGIRLTLLAMALPSTAGATPYLPWKELHDAGPQRAVEDQQLRDSLTTLSDEVRIDLFNIIRFPKSNIAACARILAVLRDKYFSGTNFSDVLSGMSGTRAHWMIRHFREGPLTRV